MRLAIKKLIEKHFPEAIKINITETAILELLLRSFFNYPKDKKSQLNVNTVNWPKDKKSQLNVNTANWPKDKKSQLNVNTANWPFVLQLEQVDTSENDFTHKPSERFNLAFDVKKLIEKYPKDIAIKTKQSEEFFHEISFNEHFMLKNADKIFTDESIAYVKKSLNIPIQKEDALSGKESIANNDENLGYKILKFFNYNLDKNGNRVPINSEDYRYERGEDSELIIHCKRRSQEVDNEVEQNPTSYSFARRTKEIIKDINGVNISTNHNNNYFHELIITTKALKTICASEFFKDEKHPKDLEANVEINNTAQPRTS